MAVTYTKELRQDILERLEMQVVNGTREGPSEPVNILEAFALLAEIDRLTAENQHLTDELTEAGAAIRPLKGEQKMSDIQETINRLRELDRTASPAPWWVGSSAESYNAIVCEDGATTSGVLDACYVGERLSSNDPDLQIITETRNALPALLAEIERLAEENQALKRENHLAWSKGHAAGWDCHIVTMQSADLLPKDQKTSSPYEENN